MSTKSTWMLTTVIVFAMAPAGRADVLFDNLGSAPCCLGPVVSGYPYGDSFFTGAAAINLNSVTVALTEDSSRIPPANLVIGAQLLADSSTSPGAILETIGTLKENSVSIGLADYTFQSPTPYTLAPNTRYWIELTSNDASEGGYVEWYLSTVLSGTTGTSGQYWFAEEGGPPLIFPDGVNGGPMLLEVSGATAASTPEPSTFAFTLIGAGLAFLGLRNRFNKSRERTESASTSDCHTATRTLLMAGLIAAALSATVTQATAGTMFSPIDFSNQANFTWSGVETDPDGQTGVYFPNNGPSGLVTLGGIPFDILSNTAKLTAWNAWVAAGGGNQQVSITIPVEEYGVTDVYTLINTYWGTSGTLASLVFTGSNGATYTDNLVGNRDIRNWCCGGAINNTSTVNVFSTPASGVNGAPGVLDMQHIVLPVSFSTQFLTSIELIDNGISGVQRTIIDGVTVESTGTASTPEPSTLATIGIGLIGLVVCRRRRARTARGFGFRKP